MWRCPACQEEFERLANVVAHFADRHPEKTGGFEKVFDAKTRTEYWYSWQGAVCPNCGHLVDLAKHKCGEEK